MVPPVVFVTGATGFVGRSLVPVLQRAGMHVRALCRDETKPLAPGADRVVWTAGDDPRVLQLALRDVAAIVHLAARVHVMNETIADPMDAYRAVNTDMTLSLARAARECGVQRFVFVSSVKVFGEQGHFRESDRPNPVDPYGRSKLEAEDQLREFGAATGMDVVVVRPPLVYGPGVKANFAALMQLVSRGWPLPFGAVNNRRSYVSADNLADAIRAILIYPTPLNDTFTITDGVDLSTAELVRQLATAMGRRVPLIPVPPSLLEAMARLIGRQASVARLLGSLTFETGRAHQVLGWAPPLSVSEGLARAVSAGTSRRQGS